MIDPAIVPGAALSESSTIELLTEVARRLSEHREWTPNQESKRNYSIALTAVEDASMRYTRGRAIYLGKFNPADLDRND